MTIQSSALCPTLCPMLLWNVIWLLADVIFGHINALGMQCECSDSSTEVVDNIVLHFSIANTMKQHLIHANRQVPTANSSCTNVVYFKQSISNLKIVSKLHSILDCGIDKSQHQVNCLVNNIPLFALLLIRLSSHFFPTRLTSQKLLANINF